MATTPQFAATVRASSAVVSAANTGRDGTGTIVAVFTAGSNGSRVDEVTIKATVTTTGGMVRLYISDGTNHRLYREQPISAVTVGANVKGEEYVLSFSSLFLPSGSSLRASTHNAEAFVVTATGGDF